MPIASPAAKRSWRRAASRKAVAPTKLPGGRRPFRQHGHVPGPLCRQAGGHLRSAGQDLVRNDQPGFASSRAGSDLRDQASRIAVPTPLIHELRSERSASQASAPAARPRSPRQARVSRHPSSFHDCVDHLRNMVLERALNICTSDSGRVGNCDRHRANRAAWRQRPFRPWLCSACRCRYVPVRLPGAPDQSSECLQGSIWQTCFSTLSPPYGTPASRKTDYPLSTIT